LDAHRLFKAEKALQGVEVMGAMNFGEELAWGPKKIKSNMQISQIQWSI